MITLDTPLEEKTAHVLGITREALASEGLPVDDQHIYDRLSNALHNIEDMKQQNPYESEWLNYGRSYILKAKENIRKQYYTDDDNGLPLMAPAEDMKTNVTLLNGKHPILSIQIEEPRAGRQMQSWASDFKFGLRKARAIVDFLPIIKMFLGHEDLPADSLATTSIFRGQPQIVIPMTDSESNTSNLYLPISKARAVYREQNSITRFIDEYEETYGEAPAKKPSTSIQIVKPGNEPKPSPKPSPAEEYKDGLLIGPIDKSRLIQIMSRMNKSQFEEIMSEVKSNRND